MTMSGALAESKIVLTSKTLGGKDGAVAGPDDAPTFTLRPKPDRREKIVTTMAPERERRGVLAH